MWIKTLSNQFSGDKIKKKSFTVLRHKCCGLEKATERERLKSKKADIVDGFISWTKQKKIASRTWGREG
jgi:hypothetical protein